MSISEHFHRSEFACRCGCGFAAVDAELLQWLERIRAQFERPVIINSGCRCATHNAAIGGSKNSRHLTGVAADFRLPGLAPSVVAQWLREQCPNRFGIGEYPRWVHLDMRQDAARWLG